MGEWRNSGVRPNPTPGVDDTPYIHFAIDQLTRDEELLGRSRDPSDSPDLAPTGNDRSVSPLSHHKGDSRYPYSDDGARPLTALLPVLRKDHSRSPSISSISEQDRQLQLEPTPEALPQGPPPQYPPRDLYRYPPLTFVPASLRLPAISILSFAGAALIALLVASAVWSSRHSGLWLYDGVGTSRYFLAEYLPQLLAVLLLIYVHVVQAALQRILPFVLLSQPSIPSNRDTLTVVPMYVTNYLTPNASLLRSRRFQLH